MKLRISTIIISFPAVATAYGGCSHNEQSMSNSVNDSQPGQSFQDRHR